MGIVVGHGRGYGAQMAAVSRMIELRNMGYNLLRKFTEDRPNALVSALALCGYKAHAPERLDPPIAKTQLDQSQAKVASTTPS